MRQEDDIQSLRWGIKALQLVNERESLSCSELMCESGLSRAAAHRVLTTLQSLAFVERYGPQRRGRYRLAGGASALSDGFGGDQLLFEAARPIMLRFTEAHGWPLALGVPADAGCFVCYTTDHATSRLLSRRRAGSYESYATSALGRVCLAARDDSQRPTGPRRHVIDDIPGERELSVAVPLHHRDRFLGALSLRYMRVASNGAQGEAERKGWLEALAVRIERSVAEVTTNR